jgi:FkbH-like protein
MYETEANSRLESRDQIPSDVAAQFAELSTRIRRRSVLPWSEHCTECVWPSCYTSCDLYSAREDGRCRRFVDGMVRIDCPESANAYILKITFKRWAKLWTPGNIRLRSVNHARRIEMRDYRIGSALFHLPGPATVRTFVTGKRYVLKKKLALQEYAAGVRPTSFILECFNPESTPVRLSFGIRLVAGDRTIPFQKLLVLDRGYHRIRIPITEIEAVFDLGRPFNVEIIPNEVERPVTLFFGLMDFVQELPEPAAKTVPSNGASSSKIKCIVWDLDHTLWNGILVEDGPEKLALKPGIRELIQELDSRGILQSIASKNNHDEAWRLLRQFEMDEYFLAPQISWQPKSQSIRAIASRLNIGLDSILFVDDSVFELQEVRTTIPEVRVVDARDCLEIANLDACQVPVTSESRRRRQMYRVEDERHHLASSFGDDYTAFLRSCDIRLNIVPLNEDNLERVHELTQRTNQMNFSGNRYSREVLRQVLSTRWLDTYVLDVADRFGSYGIVGFCVVDSREPLMTDLMFSCRIQSKRVEHAFLAWLIRKYAGSNGADVWASYRRTDRNAPSGRVFADIGMEEVAVVDGVSRLVFHGDRPVPDDSIVTVSATIPSAVVQDHDSAVAAR